MYEHNWMYSKKDLEGGMKWNIRKMDDGRNAKKKKSKKILRLIFHLESRIESDF
jgi:hypothetical protein